MSDPSTLAHSTHSLMVATDWAGQSDDVPQERDRSCTNGRNGRRRDGSDDEATSQFLHIVGPSLGK